MQSSTKSETVPRPTGWGLTSAISFTILVLIVLTLLSSVRISNSQVILPQAYLTVTNVDAPSKVAAAKLFIMTISVEWVALNMFQPPTQSNRIRIEVCEGSATDLQSCSPRTYAPSQDGEAVDWGGERTYEIKMYAPQQAAIWHLVVIPELYIWFKSSTTVWETPRDNSWAAMTWGWGEGHEKPWRELDIQVFDKASLTVKTEPSVPGALVSVDHDSLYTDAGGMVRIEASTIGSHAISVPIEVEIRQGVKAVFVKWEDEVTTNVRNVELNDNLTLTAIYKTRYLLTVESEFGDPKGAGWYDRGSSATFSVILPWSATDGEHIFVRWAGDSDSTNATGRIMMDGPKIVKAEWRQAEVAADNRMLYIEIGSAAAIIIAAILIAFLLVRRRRP